MRVGVRSIIAAAVVTALAVLGGGTIAGAQSPIRPNQHFIGLVNDRTTNAVVHTVCGGPISPGRTGPVAGGQKLSVARLASGAGYTGPFSQIYAWFQQDSSQGGPQQVKFTTYGSPQSIPTAVRVPCDGDGTVEFSSCPHLAPCAYGWVPTYVSVSFVNIAV